MSSDKPSCLKVSPWRIVKNSSTLSRCSSQTARAPKQSEAGLILPILHSLVCNPVCDRAVKYRCVKRAGSTRQWHARFRSTIARYDQYEYPAKGCWRPLTMIASTAFYKWGAEIACHPWNCARPFASLVDRHSSSKGGFFGLVMLQNIPTVNWSMTYFCPHRLGRGAGELEASWRLGQPRSKQTWSPSPDHESSATHFGKRIGWRSLVSSHWTVEPGEPPSTMRSTRLVIAAQLALGECRHKYKHEYVMTSWATHSVKHSWRRNIGKLGILFLKTNRFLKFALLCSQVLVKDFNFRYFVNFSRPVR